MSDMSTKKRIAGTAALLTAAAAATVAGAYYGYWEAFRKDEKRQAPVDEIPEGNAYAPYREKMLENIGKLMEAPYERVTVRSYDNLRLVGKLYEGEPGAPLILFFHGYRSTAERDASGGFQLCREKGWHILMVDERALGESEGKEITFGIRERFDCQTWAEYAAKRFGPETPIFIWGISMGASTVLMASELPMPESVKGIVADCGFDTPSAIIKETARRRKMPAELSGWFVGLGARIFGGFRMDEASALDSVTRARLPILLIHGEEDEIVPFEMVYAIKESCASPVEILTVPGAAHGISWYVDMPTYQEALIRFMEENMQ